MEVECELFRALDYNQKGFFVCVFLKESSESEGFASKIPVGRNLH